MASVLISGPNCHLILLIEISNFLHLVTFWSDLITGSEILAASVAQFKMQDYARARKQIIAYFNSNDCATIKLFSLFVCVNNLSHPGFIQQKEKGKIWIKASNTNLSLAGSSRSATTRAQCAWGLSYWAACIPVSNNDQLLSYTWQVNKNISSVYWTHLLTVYVNKQIRPIYSKDIVFALATLSIAISVV